MSSVGNVNNTNEYYYLNQTEGNVAQTDENVSVFTDTLEEVSDSNSVQINTESLSAEEYVSTLDDTTVDALIEVLENIISSEEDALNGTKDNNGVIAKAWDWVKNKTGIGQGSDKVQTEIDDLKSQIEELKIDPSKLAEVYENVTGNELTSEELTSLVNGEADFSDSKVVNSVSKYQQGQKQVVNTISSVASGIAVVGLVTAGVVGAPFTGGMSLGASLAAIGTLTAAGTAAYMVPQVVDGVTEADGYSASEIAEDVATGVINSAVTAASLGAGKAAGSALTKTVTNNAATIAATLGTTTEAAAQIGTKAAGLAAAETTSVLMSDGIAVGDYLVEAALNDDVDFSLETLGTTAASATAAGLAAGAAAVGTSSIIRPVLTSGTTASSQVAGRLVSSGISGAAAGASATAAAGSTSYLISCSVNGEEVNFDEWLDSTTENMAAGALTGFAAGVGFEAVQVAVGTPAPEGTASRQSGTTEDGLKYTEYLDKDGNVIARDVKVSDIKSYNSNSTELGESSSNTSSAVKENFYEAASDSSARTVRFTYTSNVINENGTVANEYAKVNDVQVYNYADNMTFSAAQKLQSTNSNVYDDSDIIDAEFVEEPVNYSSKSDVIIEQIGNETVVVEDGNVSGNQASVLQNSSGGQGVIIDADTGAIVSDVNPAQEIMVVTDSVNPFELQVSGNLNQITAVDNSSALAAASLETSAASSTQLSSIAAVNAANNYKPAIVKVNNTQSTQRYNTVAEAKEYLSAIGTEDSKTVLKSLNKLNENEISMDRLNTAIDLLEGGETKTKLQNYAKELSQENSSGTYTVDTMLEIYNALGIKPDGEIIQDENGIYHSQSSEIGTLTGRAKGETSTYSKLKNKILKLGSDLPSSAEEAKPLIGDAQGTRLVLNSSNQISADAFENSINFDENKKIIKEELPNQSDRELFIKYLSGDTEGISDEQLEQFAELRTEGLQEVSDFQTQKFVDGLSEAIKSGNIRITEIHNYSGEDGFPYLSETQLTQIETAYNDWYKETSASANIEESSYKKMYETDKKTGKEKEYLYDTKSGAKFYEDLIMETKTKDNGYTASQFNLVNQYNQMEELQFRAETVDRIAEIEHMVYDINNNKETVSGSEYDDIRQALKKIENSKETDAKGKTAQQEYDDYFNAVFINAKTTELGAYAEEPDIYEDYPLLKELFSEDELYLISIEGLEEIHNQINQKKKIQENK